MGMNLKKWSVIWIILIAVSILSVGFGGKSVSAETVQKCKVTFANSKGQVSGEGYQRLAKTVEKGTVIVLPKSEKKGYKSVWTTKINGKEYKYSGGSKVSIERNIKFCLKRYKLYTVRFYSENGKKEYTDLRKTVISGKKITIPSGKSNSDYKFIGWSQKIGGCVIKRKNDTATITGNAKFYMVRQKRTGVILCKNNGTYWKSVTNTNGRATFPAVDLKSGDMCLGWSRTKGKYKLSSSDYKVGDKIPSKNGKYYMVVFSASMDRAPSTITAPTKYDKVYIVGDSRSVDTKKALDESIPLNVEFIAKGSQGLEWFKSTAYKTLLAAVSSQPKSECKAVIINLGVNDLQKSSDYVKYMKKVASKLKQYNCKMYYLSINPVNSAMITRQKKYKARTETQVAAFNKKIYKELCTGKNKCFTYINSCSYLQKNGWCSNRYNSGIYDGLHYSNETYLRIFNYYMKYLNRN